MKQCVKQFTVYLRNEAGKFEARDYRWITYYKFGALFVQLDSDFIEDRRAWWFSDLDLTKPIPDEVQCVVCRMVTDELCEGDIVSVDNEWFGAIGYCRWGSFYYVEGRGTGQVPLWTENYTPDITPIDQHILTHRVENGEVVER